MMKPIAAATKCLELMARPVIRLSRMGTALLRQGRYPRRKRSWRRWRSIATRRLHLAISSGHGPLRSWPDRISARSYWSWPMRSRRKKCSGSECDPELDPLHGHPRFNDLLRQTRITGLSVLPMLPARCVAGQESIAVRPQSPKLAGGEHG